MITLVRLCVADYPFLQPSCGLLRNVSVTLHWAELWLVNKNFYTVWGKIQLRKNVDTCRFWVVFENPQNCRQIIGIVVLRTTLFYGLLADF